MNPQLPAYLQNKARVDLNTRATAGMGGVMPPHISIRGNSYTLIDGNGAQQPVGPFMDACVIDILGVMGKKYYENDWTPGSDEPPTCWSTNGVGPSRESVSPQSATCSECQWNVRGSETSRISNKPIKACRDEKIVALLLPQYPGMLFQLVIPPGSFKNWSGFTKPFENSGMDVSDVLIRFGFQSQVNGVMTFEVAKDQQGNGMYMPEHLVPVFNKALQSKATDALVGRNDVPIALPAPQPNQNPGLQTTQNPQGTGQTPVLATGALGTGVMHQQAAANPGFGGAPQTQAPFGAGNQSGQPVNNAPFGSTATATQPQQLQGSNFSATPAGASPSERAPRKRRTQAEIAADNAAKAAQQAGDSPTPQQPAGQSAQAPFPVNQPAQQAGFGVAPGAPNGGPAAFGGAPSSTQFGAGQAQAATTTQAGSFGIQNGADPNVDPALAEMLRGLGQ